MKTIRMLNVIEDKSIEIIVNDNVISIFNKDKERLFFKTTENTNEAINDLVINMINRHFENGYVITDTNIFNYK